jgi:hypothetical protein
LLDGENLSRLSDPGCGPVNTRRFFLRSDCRQFSTEGITYGRDRFNPVTGVYATTASGAFRQAVKALGHAVGPANGLGASLRKPVGSPASLPRCASAPACYSITSAAQTHSNSASASRCTRRTLSAAIPGGAICRWVGAFGLRGARGEMKAGSWRVGQLARLCVIVGTDWGLPVVSGRCRPEQMICSPLPGRAGRQRTRDEMLPSGEAADRDLPPFGLQLCRRCRHARIRSTTICSASSITVSLRNARRASLYRCSWLNEVPAWSRRGSWWSVWRSVQRWPALSGQRFETDEWISIGCR